MKGPRVFEKEKLAQVLSHSYSPFSKFKVAACLQTEEDEFYYGCNVENSTYGATICAERTALVKMVSEEGPKVKIKKIYLLSAVDEVITPCGICRQSLFEFIDHSENANEVEVVSFSKDFKKKRTFSVQALLPDGFKLDPEG